MKVVFQKLRAHCSSMAIINWEPFCVLFEVNGNFIFVGTSVKSFVSNCRITFNVRFQVARNAIRNFRDFFVGFFWRLFLVALLAGEFEHGAFEGFGNKVCGDSILCDTCGWEGLLERFRDGVSRLDEGRLGFGFVFLFVGFLRFFIVGEWLFHGGHEGEIFGGADSG